jgi:hypothetical protein
MCWCWAHEPRHIAPSRFRTIIAAKFQTRKLRLAQSAIHWISTKSPSEDKERGGRNRIPDVCSCAFSSGFPVSLPPAAGVGAVLLQLRAAVVSPDGPAECWRLRSCLPQWQLHCVRKARIYRPSRSLPESSRHKDFWPRVDRPRDKEGGQIVPSRLLLTQQLCRPMPPNRRFKRQPRLGKRWVRQPC